MKNIKTCVLDHNEKSAVKTLKLNKEKSNNILSPTKCNFLLPPKIEQLINEYLKSKIRQLRLLRSTFKKYIQLGIVIKSNKKMSLEIPYRRCQKNTCKRYPVLSMQDTLFFPFILLIIIKIIISILTV